MMCSSLVGELEGHSASTKVAWNQHISRLIGQ